MKIQNTLVGLGFIFLTIAGSPKVSAQAYCGFPLTAQQIEHDEGDQFYASFVHDYSLCWHKMVFNSLIHKGSAKKIEVSQYREITAFDELPKECMKIFRLNKSTLFIVKKTNIKTLKSM